MNTLIAIGGVIGAINLFLVFCLARIAANQRRSIDTLARMTARSVSVERRAMAEWRSR